MMMMMMMTGSVTTCNQTHMAQQQQEPQLPCASLTCNEKEACALLTLFSRSLCHLFFPISLLFLDYFHSLTITTPPSFFLEVFLFHLQQPLLLLCSPSLKGFHVLVQQTWTSVPSSALCPLLPSPPPPPSPHRPHVLKPTDRSATDLLCMGLFICQRAY